MEKTRGDGWQLLTEFVKVESLRRHCLMVETAMRAYAVRFGEPEEEWGLVGLVHDFDYEVHPTADLHPEGGVPILRERGFPEWLIRAIRSHAEYLNVTRESRMERTLYAVDELTGFIAAVALVRPSRRVSDVTASSVRKKMKDKAFARPVHRDTLMSSATELGVDFDEHVAFVIEALAANAGPLGLDGANDAPG